MGTFVCKICGKIVDETDRRYGDDICSRECFLKEFWKEKVKWAENNDRTGNDGYAIRVVVQDVLNHCIIGPESNVGGFRGSNGNINFFEMLTGDFKGKIFVTTNLWHQGIVAYYKDQLPINAVKLSKTTVRKMSDKEFISWHQEGRIETIPFDIIMKRIREPLFASGIDWDEETAKHLN